MAIEIERKFLVDFEKWSKIEKNQGIIIKQGYIVVDSDKTIRIRTKNDYAFITIKGKSVNSTRLEYEYEIPLKEANEILSLFSLGGISKTRYEVFNKDKLWEIDVFHDENDGLIIAEIELSHESEEFELPDWITDEVTKDQRYYNSYLASNPYKNWK